MRGNMDKIVAYAYVVLWDAREVRYRCTRMPYIQANPTHLIISVFPPKEANLNGNYIKIDMELIMSYGVVIFNTDIGNSKYFDFNPILNEFFDYKNPLKDARKFNEH